MGPVARELLGEPNRAMSSAKELRFGKRGSISVDLEKGTWFDHETQEGGGVLDMIRSRISIATQWCATANVSRCAANTPVHERRSMTWSK